MEVQIIVTLVKDLRKRYFKNKINIDIDSQVNEWSDIKRVCKNFNINSDVIIMDEEVFSKMEEKNILVDFIFKK